MRLLLLEWSRDDMLPIEKECFEEMLECVRESRPSLSVNDDELCAGVCDVKCKEQQCAHC